MEVHVQQMVTIMISLVCVLNYLKENTVKHVFNTAILNIN